MKSLNCAIPEYGGLLRDLSNARADDSPQGRSEREANRRVVSTRACLIEHHGLVCSRTFSSKPDSQETTGVVAQNSAYEQRRAVKTEQQTKARPQSWLQSGHVPQSLPAIGHLSIANELRPGQEERRRDLASLGSAGHRRMLSLGFSLSRTGDAQKLRVCPVMPYI